MAPAALDSVTLNKVEHWHKDQLGSLVATTGHGAAITARYSYDPFGKRRTVSGNYDPDGKLVYDWNNTNSGTDRGYTGHEHLAADNEEGSDTWYLSSYQAQSRNNLATVKGTILLMRRSHL